METIRRIPQLPNPTLLKSEFAQQLHAALSNFGAAYIPVSQSIEDENLVDYLKKLFALSAEEKRSLAKQLPSPWQGVFIGLGQEQLGDNQEDYKEVFDLNLEEGTYAQWVKRRSQTDNPPALTKLAENSLTDNKDVAEIFQSLCNIFRAFQVQANHVLAALEMVYNQPPSSLVQCHGKNSTLRSLHYPPAPHFIPGAIRLGAHQDYTGITLLWQDSTGGLEILTPQQEWIPIDIPPGCIGVIVSEVMQKWSGETLHGAPHRVRIMNPQQVHSERYAIAFFCETNHDWMIHPGALVADTKNGSQPIVIKDFLSQKYDQILANLNF